MKCKLDSELSLTLKRLNNKTVVLQKICFLYSKFFFHTVETQACYNIYSVPELLRYSTKDNITVRNSTYNSQRSLLLLIYNDRQFYCWTFYKKVEEEYGLRLFAYSVRSIWIRYVTQFIHTCYHHSMLKQYSSPIFYYSITGRDGSKG